MNSSLRDNPELSISNGDRKRRSRDHKHHRGGCFARRAFLIQGSQKASPAPNQVGLAAKNRILRTDVPTIPRAAFSVFQPSLHQAHPLQSSISTVLDWRCIGLDRMYWSSPALWIFHNRTNSLFGENPSRWDSFQLIVLPLPQRAFRNFLS